MYLSRSTFNKGAFKYVLTNAHTKSNFLQSNFNGLAPFSTSIIVRSRSDGSYFNVVFNILKIKIKKPIKFEIYIF